MRMPFSAIQSHIRISSFHMHRGLYCSILVNSSLFVTGSPYTEQNIELTVAVRLADATTRATHLTEKLP